MTLSFQHHTRAQRVLFGSGTAAAQLRAEVKRLSATTPFVVAADRHLPLIRDAGLSGATRYADPVEHVPIEVARKARSIAEEVAADVLISIGGGSATGWPRQSPSPAACRFSPSRPRLPAPRRPTSGA